MSNGLMLVPTMMLRTAIRELDLVHPNPVITDVDHIKRALNAIDDARRVILAAATLWHHQIKETSDA